MGLNVPVPVYTEHYNAFKMQLAVRFCNFKKSQHTSDWYRYFVIDIKIYYIYNTDFVIVLSLRKGIILFIIIFPSSALKLR